MMSNIQINNRIKKLIELEAQKKAAAVLCGELVR